MRQPYLVETPTNNDVRMKLGKLKTNRVTQNVNSKVKLSHYYTPQTCSGREEVQPLLILDLGSRWG
jgi:hypothetical protein